MTCFASRYISKPNVMHNAAGQIGDHRTLAHLLAAHSRATPKQAKEPSYRHKIN